MKNVLGAMITKIINQLHSSKFQRAVCPRLQPQANIPVKSCLCTQGSVAKTCGKRLWFFGFFCRDFCDAKDLYEYKKNLRQTCLFCSEVRGETKINFNSKTDFRFTERKGKMDLCFWE